MGKIWIRFPWRNLKFDTCQPVMYGAALLTLFTLNSWFLSDELGKCNRNELAEAENQINITFGRFTRLRGWLQRHAINIYSFLSSSTSWFHDLVKLNMVFTTHIHTNSLHLSLAPFLSLIEISRVPYYFCNISSISSTIHLGLHPYALIR